MLNWFVSIETKWFNAIITFLFDRLIRLIDLLLIFSFLKIKLTLLQWECAQYFMTFLMNKSVLPFPFINQLILVFVTFWSINFISNMQFTFMTVSNQSKMFVASSILLVTETMRSRRPFATINRHKMTAPTGTSPQSQKCVRWRFSKYKQGIAWCMYIIVKEM